MKLTSKDFGDGQPIPAKQDLLKAMKGHILAEAWLTGVYQRAR